MNKMLFNEIVKEFGVAALLFGVLSFIFAYFFHQAFMDKWVEIVGQLIVGVWLLHVGLFLYKYQKKHDKSTTLVSDLIEITKSTNQRIKAMSAASSPMVKDYLEGAEEEFKLLSAADREAMYSADSMSVYDLSENMENQIAFVRGTRGDVNNLNFLIMELLNLENELVRKSRMLILALKVQPEIIQKHQTLYKRLVLLESAIRKLSILITVQMEKSELENLSFMEFEKQLADVKEKWQEFKDRNEISN